MRIASMSVLDMIDGEGAGHDTDEADADEGGCVEGVLGRSPQVAHLAAPRQTFRQRKVDGMRRSHYLSLSLPTITMVTKEIGAGWQLASLGTGGKGQLLLEFL